ncbi:hypothetical protein AWC38_SpisGene8312 [Stylophora pistillata]|uniref:C2H2-type domain-containing protein n=1 Tax=Stylophora pistillata TaxID=50429 RepID=A0A2B4SAV5_STYPI|nr:hypothetical protein AWC38_SpisGene8312 [Stylophora pistillata]
MDTFGPKESRCREESVCKVRLLELNPNLQDAFPSFRGVSLDELMNSRSLFLHSKRLMAVVEEAVSSLDDAKELIEDLTNLGERHLAMSITEKHLKNLQRAGPATNQDAKHRLLANKGTAQIDRHIARMEDTRLPKQIFYSELSEGQRPRGRPRLRYKDTLKRSLKKCNISVDQWENMANDRSAWPTATHKAVESFEHERRSRQVAKRAARKARSERTQHSTACPDCGRSCASQFGLRSHRRTHLR